MRLPDSLYRAVKHHMAGHQAWHFARMRPEWFDPSQRAEVAAARAQFPNLKYLNEAGAGDEFLRFHREMLREMKWLILHTSGHAYKLDEWKALPQWLEQRLGQAYCAGAIAALPALVAGKSADALGNFIEHTALDESDLSNIHNLSHGAIATYEINRYPGDTRLEDASMSDFGQAQHNGHFWSLHSWIDGFFAAWQTNNGEAVDVSPKKPSHPHVAVFQPSDALRDRVRGVFFGNDLWNTSLK